MVYVDYHQTDFLPYITAPDSTWAPARFEGLTLVFGA